MAKKKFYTVDKEINGVVYTAQFNGVSAALRAIDETYIDGTDTTSSEKFPEYILEHVIVQPKGLTPDDFDSIKELQEVVTFARKVMQGEIKGEIKPEKKAE